jgi:hypothetical protein
MQLLRDGAPGTRCRPCIKPRATHRPRHGDAGAHRKEPLGKASATPAPRLMVQQGRQANDGWINHGGLMVRSAPIYIGASCNMVRRTADMAAKPAAKPAA